jgi:predicted ATPase
VVTGTPNLVGREEELGSLLALVDAPERLPAVAVMAGEAGIGKTAAAFRSLLPVSGTDAMSFRVAGGLTS